MPTHRHTWTGGLAAPDASCGRMVREDWMCPTTGAHVTQRCACGAIRTTCPQGGPYIWPSTLPERD